jgi:transposase InsO family protein
MTKITSSLDPSCSRGHFEGLCHACPLGRHTRLPFTTSSSRDEQAFDLVHCDLLTSPVLSLSGYKYYLVILDDFSHFLWTFPLRLKSDTFTTLTHFFAWVSTQFHRPVRALQCDNGREFDNHASRSFFLTHGVQLRLSCPYTSAQNGRAERMIRTTTNMIRCLLFQASLPASYCAEALHTATHLLNRLPSKAVSHPTPYFALYGTAPTYAHLRVFDCVCYPNTSATAPHKLSPRSTRCLFLGYSSDHKGYRCLDLASHRIIISRHVVFNEDVFPLAGPSPPTDLDSLLESDPVPTPYQPTRLAPLSAPRAAPTPRLAPIPAPRAAPSITPAPRAAPPTPPAPCAAPSTPTARFADPALVYRRRRHVTTSAPADPGPSTSPVRFADPAVVYHRR